MTRPAAQRAAEGLSCSETTQAMQCSYRRNARTHLVLCVPASAVAVHVAAKLIFLGSPIEITTPTTRAHIVFGKGASALAARGAAERLQLSLRPPALHLLLQIAKSEAAFRHLRNGQVHDHGAGALAWWSGIGEMLACAC